MYDTWKTAHLEFNIAQLNSMLTRQAIYDGWIDERYFIEVLKIEFNPDNNTFRTDCQMYKYLEH